jgi:antitoxin component of RelBE/YafQ-DinJ toxin-antitoxin module
MKTFDAPIAGANYTSDIRNYPWHRPPEIVEYDEGVDYLITKIKEPETHELVFSMLEIDMEVATVVSTLMMQAISKGKFPIDLAVLMAGPVARYISIIADSQNIKYDMGVGDGDRIKITPTSLKMALGIFDEEEPTQTPEEAKEAPPKGLMGAVSSDDTTPAPDDEQAAMLGLNNTEEEIVDGMA